MTLDMVEWRWGRGVVGDWEREQIKRKGMRQTTKKIKSLIHSRI